MAQIREKIQEQIEDILEKNKDAIKGYEKAAEKAEKPSVRNYFTEKAKNRRVFNNDLITEMRATYTDFDHDGTASGTIHRAWMDVKAFFSGDSDEAMLEEAARGDQSALEEYQEAIDNNDIPMSLKTILINQAKEIEMDIEQSKSYKKVS